MPVAKTFTIRDFIVINVERFSSSTNAILPNSNISDSIKGSSNLYFSFAVCSMEIPETLF